MITKALSGDITFEIWENFYDMSYNKFVIGMVLPKPKLTTKSIIEE